MTNKQYHAALHKLNLRPYGKETQQALGLSRRQLARLAAGGDPTPMLELLLRMYLQHGLPK